MAIRRCLLRINVSLKQEAIPFRKKEGYLSITYVLILLIIS